jgi:hypothetical protein
MAYKGETVTFETDKILTIDARVYIASQDKNPRDYDFMGVKGTVSNMKVPVRTEIVTNFVSLYGATGTPQEGIATALIPKPIPKYRGLEGKTVNYSE